MKKNEELFYLIKSLSKSEKRYFKLSMPASDATEYLILFNAIEAQKKYDEAAIKTLFKDKAFVNQLTTIKNYLKLRILQSLRNYHAKASKNAELMDIVRNVEILYRKGLYSVCESELKRAEKKAYNFQQNIILFYIQDWKRKVHQALYPQGFDTFMTIVNQQKNTLASANEYVRLLSANVDPASFSLSHKKSATLQNRTLKILHKYRKQLLAEHSDKAKHTLEELVKEWEQNPELLKEYFVMYFSVNNNLLGFLVHSKQYKEAFVRILLLKQKVNAIHNVSAALIKEKLRLYNLELEIHRNLKGLQATHTIVDEILSFIKDYESLVPETYRLSFCFQFAALYFQKEEYRNALQWVNDIFNNQTKKDRKDLILYTHWLNLLIHYQLGNGSTLIYLINTIKKIIKKHKNIASYEKIILKFLVKTVEDESLSKKEAFKRLKKQLVNDPIPDTVLGYLDFNSWIDKNC